jgi:CRISPR-associated protein Cas1
MELIINSYGAYLHVKEQMFEVRLKPKGETQPQIHHFAVHKVKSILMAVGTALSTDAIKLAMYHNIDIVFLEHNGHPLGRVWHSKLGSTTKIRKKQLEASLSPRAIDFVKHWVGHKVENQLLFVKGLCKHRAQHLPYLQEKIDKLSALKTAIMALEGTTVAHIADTLRGLEGTAGRLYFETLSFVLPKAYQFEGRSSRPAKDAFNALLNYAYGVLYSRVERALIIAGLDPYVGFLHRDDYNQLSFVFDFIEPFRTFADKTVFRLMAAKKINKSHTDDITNGVSLNKEGKALLMQAFGEYLDQDTIRYRGRNQTRGNIIQLEAHRFAQILLETTDFEPQNTSQR